MTSSFGVQGALCKGVHAVDWGLPRDEPVLPGQLWRWRGEAVRLDGSGQALWLGRPLARADHRPRARSRMARLALAPGTAALTGETAPDPASDLEPPPGGLVLTDGRHLFPARLVTSHGRTAIVFDPWLPPPETDLWVTASADGGAAPRPATPEPGGFAAGTLLPTPGGWRAVETLAPGDRILTRDSGPQPVLWRAQTQLSGAELLLHPRLRPLRLNIPPGTGAESGAIRLAPGHRVVVPAPPGFDELPEALAAAADLEHGGRFRRDLACPSVNYIQLMLPRHEIVSLCGVECETFHPALADPAELRRHARALERAFPGLTSTPARFGEPARRCLSRAEAALLAAA